MLILPGIAQVGDNINIQGLLDRPSALKYAELRGYAGHVLDVSGETGPDSRQVKAALSYIKRAIPDVTAIYGFSGGGYNARHLLTQLSGSVELRALYMQIKLVVIVGAPSYPEVPNNPGALYKGPWELVYRTDPPEGHMYGPKALLADYRKLVGAGMELG